MKIIEVEIGWGYTKNIGNYESKRSYVAYRYQVGQNETHQQVAEKLERMAKAEVRRIITGKKIEKKSKTFEDLY